MTDQNDEASTIRVTFRVNQPDFPELHQWLSSFKHWGELSRVVRDALSQAIIDSNGRANPVISGSVATAKVATVKPKPVPAPVVPKTVDMSVATQENVKQNPSDANKTLSAADQLLVNMANQF